MKFNGNFSVHTKLQRIFLDLNLNIHLNQPSLNRIMEQR